LRKTWEKDLETGEEEWVPYMLHHPLPPGYPGPVRFGEWLGVSSGGNQIGPAPLYGWVKAKDREAAKQVQDAE